MVYLKDLEGRCQMINWHWAELFDETQASVVGMTDRDIFSADIADGFRANDLQLLARGEAVEFEEVAPDQDGLHTYLSCKVPWTGSDGVPTQSAGSRPTSPSGSGWRRLLV